MSPKDKSTNIVSELQKVTDERLLLQAAVDVVVAEERKKKESAREKYDRLLAENSIKDKSAIARSIKGAKKKKKVAHVEDFNVANISRQLRLVKSAKHVNVALDLCKKKPATHKEELVLRIYKFILQIHAEKPWVFSKEYRCLYSEFDLQVKFWGFVFETWFGASQKILLHWGDTMSGQCKKLSLRFKLDLRLLVWKKNAAVFDGGTGEVAKKAISSKLFSDKLKSVLATKCHLNDFLRSVPYLDKSDIPEVRFPIVQIMGLDAHLCTMRLKDKKSYVLEEVCAFPFPCSLFRIRSEGIENLVNGLSKIESLVLELEKLYEEGRSCQEDSMERVTRGSKRPK